MLRFAEEILVLVLDEGQGDLAASLPARSLNLALAGAVLMDLALEDRIDTDLKRLMLVDSTPFGDDILDPALAEIANDGRSRDTGYWLGRIAGQGDRIRRAALARLIERGILRSEAHGLLSLAPSVSRSRRYPTADGRQVEEARLRIMRVLFSDDIPDPRDIAMIALASACGVFRTISVVGGTRADPGPHRPAEESRPDRPDDESGHREARCARRAIPGVRAPEGDPGRTRPSVSGQRPRHEKRTRGVPCPAVPRAGPDLPNKRTRTPVRVHRGAGGGQFPDLARKDRLPVARAHGQLPQPDGLVAFDPDHGRDRSCHDAEGPGQGIRRPGHGGPVTGGRRHHPRRDRRVAGGKAVRSVAGVPARHRRTDGVRDGALFAPRLHE